MIVIYHDNCWDGFGAAWVAHKIYPDATFIPAKYGDKPPDVTEQDVLMVDFSYPAGHMEEIASKAAYLKVLDHHKTAQEILKDKSYAIFDMNRSGAGLAWDELIGKPRPLLIDFVEDRDLWRWKLKDSKEISAVIASYPKEFEVWDKLAYALDNNYFEAVKEGRAILRYTSQSTNEACLHHRILDIGGYKVPAVNTCLLMSEVGDILCRLYPDAPFAAYYFDREDGKRQWGLRSRGDFDVSEVAKELGGGGHKGAAGFIGEING